MRVLLLVFAVLLLFSLLASAQADAATVWGRAWQTIAFTALLMSYFIVGIFYALGVGFSSPRLLAFAKHEFYQTSATAVILGMLIGSSGILSFLFDAFKGQSLLNPENARESSSFCEGMGAVRSGSWATLQGAAIDYSNCLVDRNAANLKFLIFLNILLGYFSSYSFYIDPMGFGGVNLAPFTGFRVMMDMIGYAVSAQVLNLIQLKAQYMLLTFARDYMFSLVLPLGIALRSFTITRSAGGALIAIAVGFYIVFPLAYIFTGEIVGAHCKESDCGRYSSGPDWTGIDTIDTLIGGKGTADMTALMGIGFQMMRPSGSGFAGIGVAGDPDNFEGSADSKEAGFINEFGSSGAVGTITYVSVVASAILPIMSLIMALQFVRNLALVMGADVDFSALVKII